VAFSSLYAQPEELNNLGSAVFAGDFYDVAYNNGYVWLADGHQYYNGNLKIFDISDPANPYLAATESYPNASAFRLEAAGGRMYVSVIGRGVLIYDSSDPSDPVLIGEYPEINTVNDMSEAGDFLYILVQSVGLKVLDVSDPSNIQVLNQTAVSGVKYSLSVNDNNILTIASGSTGILFYDVNDPVHPLYLDTVTMTLKGFHDVVCDDDHAYAVYISTMINSGGFAVVDIADPPNFEIIAQPTAFGVEEFPECGLWLEGDTLYFAATQGGMGIWDISDPGSPNRTGGYGGAWLPGNLAQWSTRATSGGGYAYTISPDRLLTPTHNKMYIFDISDLTDPQPIGSYDAPDFVNDMVASGDFAYVAASTDGMITVDISNPEEPEIAAVMEVFDLNLNGKSVLYEDGFVYISGGWKTLAVISVADPFNPEVISEYSDFIASHTDMDKQGNIMAFTGDGVPPSPAGWLRLLDVSDPEFPQPLSIVTFTTGALCVDITDQYAYLGREESFMVFDISNVYNPVEVSQTGTGNKINSVVIDGNLAYLADESSGLTVMDITNPYDPRPLNSMELGDVPQDLEISGDSLFIAAFGSLLMVNITDPANPVIEEQTPINGDGKAVSVDGNRIFLADKYAMHLYSYESTGIRGFELSNVQPSKLLLKSYPNPFNNSAVISYFSVDAGNSEIKIYNILGKEVFSFSKFSNAGELVKLKWTGTDTDGNIMPSGIYLVELINGNNKISRIIEILR